MEKKKISVIIPVYKVERFIHACVDSVLQQTYENLEVILVDDGSPDQCPQICDRYEKEDTRVRVIHQENQGLSGARNTGTAVATGEYILYLDSDDFLKNDYCETVMQAALDSGADIVVGEIRTVDEGGKQIPVDDYQISKRQVLDRKEAMRRLIDPTDIRGYAWGKLYRRTIMEEIEYPVGKVYEDRYTVPKYFDHSEKICLCPGAVCFYRMTGSSITHQVNAKNLYDLLDAEKWLTEYCREHYPELAGTMESVYFGRYIYIWIKLYDSGQKAEVERLVQRMKQVYKEYASGAQIRSVHKISYKMIFAMPALYRKLAHMVHLDA